MQVVGNGVRVGVDVRQQSLRHQPMPEPSARWQDALVERRPGKGVDETNAGAVPLGLQQVRLHRLLHDVQDPFVLQFRRLRPEGERHILPNHGRDRQRLPRRLAQACDPAVDHLTDSDGTITWSSAASAHPPSPRRSSASPSNVRNNSVAKNGLPSAWRSR